MNILITGANGFIGKNLVAELASIADIRLKIISRTRPNFPCDFLSYDDFESNKFESEFFNDIDHAIHLAAVAHQFQSLDEKVLIEINDTYLKKLIGLLNPHSLKKFIFMSSFAVSLIERNIVLDTRHYAELKKKSEEILKEKYNSEFNQTCFIFLRPPMVYGLGAPGNFNKLIKLLNWPLPLPFGHFDFDRSFIHIKNLTNLMALLVLKKDLVRGVHTIEVSDPWDETFASFCKRLSKSVKSKAIIVPFPIILLKLTLTFIGKAELFKKLSLSYKIDHQSIMKRYQWNPPVSQSESFIDLGAHD